MGPATSAHCADPFLGADFEFLAANVVDDATGETIFPPYTIRKYDGVKVAFIGMTLKGTPQIVTSSGIDRQHNNRNNYERHYTKQECSR